MSDKVIVIEDGTIIQSGSAKDITHISREKSVKFSSIKANT
jgi:ABC-type antimicrobial peptide transport system ATPase subunit